MGDNATVWLPPCEWSLAWNGVGGRQRSVWLTMFIPSALSEPTAKISLPLPHGRQL